MLRLGMVVMPRQHVHFGISIRYGRWDDVDIIRDMTWQLWLLRSSERHVNDWSGVHTDAWCTIGRGCSCGGLLGFKFGWKGVAFTCRWITPVPYNLHKTMYIMVAAYISRLIITSYTRRWSVVCSLWSIVPFKSWLPTCWPKGYLRATQYD